MFLVGWNDWPFSTSANRPIPKRMRGRWKGALSNVEARAVLLYSLGVARAGSFCTRVRACTWRDMSKARSALPPGPEKNSLTGKKIFEDFGSRFEQISILFLLCCQGVEDWASTSSRRWVMTFLTAGYTYFYYTIKKWIMEAPSVVVVKIPQTHV